MYTFMVLETPLAGQDQMLVVWRQEAGQVRRAVSRERPCPPRPRHRQQRLCDTKAPLTKHKPLLFEQKTLRQDFPVVMHLPCFTLQREKRFRL